MMYCGAAAKAAATPGCCSLAHSTMITNKQMITLRPPGFLHAAAPTVLTSTPLMMADHDASLQGSSVLVHTYGTCQCERIYQPPPHDANSGPYDTAEGLPACGNRCQRCRCHERCPGGGRQLPSIPLEILPAGEFDPIYRIPLDVQVGLWGKSCWAAGPAAGAKVAQAVL